MTQATGTILSVDTAVAGSRVSEEYVADSFELAVYDVFDFAPDGGTVLIGGVAYAYTSADWDTDTLTLDAGSGFTGAAVEDPVLVVPYAETKNVLVDLADGGDALEVNVPHALAALLEDGVREPDEAEAALIEETSPGVWQLVNVLDRAALLTPEAGAELPPPDPSDGLPPDEAVTLAATGGLGSTFLRWEAIENADPVTYEVHVATFPDFIPDGTTLVTLTPATSLNARTLPDGSPLLYDTPYYWRVVATDADGAGPSSDVVTATLFRVSGPDIAVDYVYAGSVLANQILTGELQADVTLSGSIKTATSGARVELGAFGFVVYNSAGVPTTLLGSDGT